MAKCGNCISGQHEKCTGWIKPFEECTCDHSSPKPSIKVPPVSVIFNK
jgi:hypothetical protein